MYCVDCSLSLLGTSPQSQVGRSIVYIKDFTCWGVSWLESWRACHWPGAVWPSQPGNRKEVSHPEAGDRPDVGEQDLLGSPKGKLWVDPGRGYGSPISDGLCPSNTRYPQRPSPREQGCVLTGGANTEVWWSHHAAPRTWFLYKYIHGK